MAIFHTDHPVPVFVIDSVEFKPAEGSYVLPSFKSSPAEVTKEYVMDFQYRAIRACGGYIIANLHDGVIGLYVRGETIYKTELQREKSAVQVADLYSLIPKINELAIPVYKDGLEVGSLIDIPEIGYVSAKGAEGNIRIEADSSLMTVSVYDKDKLLYRLPGTHQHLYDSAYTALTGYLVSQAVKTMKPSEILLLEGSKEFNFHAVDISTMDRRLILSTPARKMYDVLPFVNGAITYDESAQLKLSKNRLFTLKTYVNGQTADVYHDILKPDRISVPGSSLLLDATMSLMELAEKKHARITGPDAGRYPSDENEIESERR